MKRPKDPGPYPVADEYRSVRNASRWFVWSGERRKPRRGEWFISGAPAEVYLAPAELDYECFIARPCAMRKCSMCGGRGEVAE